MCILVQWCQAVSLLGERWVVSGADGTNPMRPPGNECTFQFACGLGLSADMPNTSYPAALMVAWLSRKPHAWVVHPGVLALG